MLGVISGLTSSLFVALNGIYTKKALDVEEMDSVKLTLHINVNASFLLLIPSIFTGQVRSYSGRSIVSSVCAFVHFLFY